MADCAVKEQAGIWARARRGIALFATVALAACQVVPKADRALPPPPEKPATPEVVQGLPRDTERHRVALVVPMTGANAAVGQSIANATTMALLDTKAENVRITTYDSATGVATAVRKAVADGNRLILGPLTSDDVRAANPVARAAKVPMISFSNDTNVAGNGTFILGYVPTQSVTRVVGYARAQGANSFAALVPNGAYGERAGGAFLEAVNARGGTVVSMQTFDRSASSLAAAIRRLGTTSSYDALLIAESGRIAVQAAPMIRREEHGKTARLLGTELWNVSSEVAGQPALNGAWYASVSDGLFRQLSNKYRARYNAAPNRLASLGYDAVLLTVRIAQDWKVGTAFPVNRLTDREGFAGIDGAFRFGSDGVAERALEVQAVGGGVVDAAPRSFSGR